MKTCSKCKISKKLTEFYKRKDSKDGHRNECKVCKDLTSKEYSLNNIEKVKNIKRKYYENNKDIVIERTKIWQDENKEKYKKISNKYREKDSTKERLRAYYEENKEYLKIRNKEYKINNKETINENHRRRYKSDVLYKIKFMLRNMLYKSMVRNGYKKNSKTTEIIGCSFEEFKIYLESKFEPWMNWENYGLYNGELSHGWDIDHIKPLYSVKTEEDLIKLNHYTNLQPLCSKLNRDIKRLDDLKLYK